ncbi:MAG: hypothetical protein ACR2L5_03775 [Candidatus Actinomarinaceae bacterium]
MISSKSNPDLLIFNWKDPQEDETGWKIFKDSFIGLADCFSCGWVIDETKECYVLAADLIIKDGRITDTGRRQSIYKGKLNVFWRINFNIYDKKMEITQESKLN